MISKFKAMKNDVDTTTERNKGLVVEVLNCAEFLAAVNDIIGEDGPQTLKFDIREELPSAKPANMVDMMKNANISRHILGVPIGEVGWKVTLNDVLAMLHAIKGKDDDIKYCIQLLDSVKCIIGKKGPYYFEHGIVEASNRDCALDGMRIAQNSPCIKPGTIGSTRVNATGELLKVPIGKTGHKIGLEDVISAFRVVSKHEEIEKFRKNGRGYFHEGFKMKGKSVVMLWGS